MPELPQQDDLLLAVRELSKRLDRPVTARPPPKNALWWFKAMGAVAGALMAAGAVISFFLMPRGEAKEIHKDLATATKAVAEKHNSDLAVQAERDKQHHAAVEGVKEAINEQKQTLKRVERFLYRTRRNGE